MNFIMKVAELLAALAQCLEHSWPNRVIHGQGRFSQQPAPDFVRATCQFAGERNNPIIAVQREAGEGLGEIGSLKNSLTARNVSFNTTNAGG